MKGKARLLNTNHNNEGILDGTMMTRTEIQRRLHDMVDHLFEDVPDEWLVRGVYPMLRITMRSTDENAVDDAFTLVVGIDMPDRD